MVQEIQKQHRDNIHSRDHCEHRNVARAFRYHRNQFAPRLSPVVLGYVLADDVGLVHVHWHDWFLLCTRFSVHTLPANHLDFRDADDTSIGGG